MNLYSEADEHCVLTSAVEPRVVSFHVHDSVTC
jgi:hypothetical protein